MSCSKYRYTERCDGRPCCGDCDNCDFDPTEPTLNEAVSIVQAFITWGEKREGFDEALEKVTEFADNMSTLTGDSSVSAFRAKIELWKKAEFAKGVEKGHIETEQAMFNDMTYKLHDKEINVSRCIEIDFDGYGQDTIRFVPETVGSWEYEPDYDREGNRVLRRVWNCSECQKPIFGKKTRFCPNCGSWNLRERGEEE